MINISEVRFENATYNNVNFGDIEPRETTENEASDN